MGGLGRVQVRQDGGGDVHAVRLAQDAQGEGVGDTDGPLVDRVDWTAGRGKGSGSRGKGGRTTLAARVDEAFDAIPEAVTLTAG
ncbi:hypothetical protein GCM10023080_056240 [Streptomyces pseudoechinosporeus]